MGLLIDLEGIDGAGKTTVAQALVESLGPSRVRMVHHKELGSEQSTEARLLRQLGEDLEDLLVHRGPVTQGTVTPKSLRRLPVS